MIDNFFFDCLKAARHLDNEILTLFLAATTVPGPDGALRLRVRDVTYPSPRCEGAMTLRMPLAAITPQPGLAVRQCRGSLTLRVGLGGLAGSARPLQAASARPRPGDREPRLTMAFALRAADVPEGMARITDRLAQQIRLDPFSTGRSPQPMASGDRRLVQPGDS